jgi:hypothetical protein
LEIGTARPPASSTPHPKSRPRIPPPEHGDRPCLGQPSARPRTIATLLAWTILNKPTEALLPALLDAGQRVKKATAPDGDVLPHLVAILVAILADTISQVEGPAKTAIVMTRPLGTLDEERRTAAMQLFLSPPRSAT